MKKWYLKTDYLNMKKKNQLLPHQKPYFFFPSVRKRWSSQNISWIIRKSGILELKSDVFCIIGKGGILLDQKCSFSFWTEKNNLAILYDR